MKKSITRRDKCHLVSKRMLRLNEPESALAWKWLAAEIEALGRVESVTPKYRHLIRAIRLATIFAAKPEED